VGAAGAGVVSLGAGAESAGAAQLEASWVLDAASLADARLPHVTASAPSNGRSPRITEPHAAREPTNKYYTDSSP